MLGRIVPVQHVAVELLRGVLIHGSRVLRPGPRVHVLRHVHVRRVGALVGIQPAVQLLLLLLLGLRLR